MLIVRAPHRLIKAAAKTVGGLLRALFKADELFVAVVGSLPLGLATQQSDVDLVCAGSIARELFVQQVTSAVSRSPLQSIRIERDIVDALVPLLVLNVADVTVDIA
jgi:hypothetical protein